MSDFFVQRLGALWYVVDEKKQIRSQGYTNIGMAQKARRDLETEYERNVTFREGEGHD